jgi:serine protease Do/serine protease DegQ
VRLVSEGFQVFAVEGGSAAAAEGLLAGDLILLIDGAPIVRLDDLAAALGAEGRRVLSITRGGEPVEIVLP